METKTYTPEQQAANRTKWVEALRSGQFKQGRNWLVNDAGHCCLGVACVLAEAEGVTERSQYEFSMLPPWEVVEWLGLNDCQGDTGVLDLQGQRVNLTILNDTLDFTFADIADVIEGGSLEVQA